MDEYIGIIKLFAGTYAPDGYYFCDGTLLPIQQYAALYSIIGITYGGDGRTNFALPDLRSRVPVGAGRPPTLPAHTVGEKWGSESTTIVPGNLPFTLSPVQVAPGSGVGVVTSTPAVAVQLSNSQPSIGLNYIICWNGMYPPRP